MDVFLLPGKILTSELWGKKQLQLGDCMGTVVSD